MHNDDSTRHAFRVASGLDSMVLGEPQILGQLKDAVRLANEAGSLGTTLNQLFQRSFAVAKEVRSSTEIGTHSVSMAAAAVRLSEQLFENIQDTRVLFVGAGEMIQLCAVHFAAKKVKQIAIANRSQERAQKLADSIQADTFELWDLPNRLHEFDIVVSCTASSLPLIGLGAVQRAIKLRKGRPMFMLDLAVPRDIEPEVGALEDVYLYQVDDLAALVESGRESRKAAISQAEIIVESGVQKFSSWLQVRNQLPLIQLLQNQADDWKKLELVRAKKMLDKGEDIQKVLEAMASGLTQKMLHHPLRGLNDLDDVQRQKSADAVQHLFGQVKPANTPFGAAPSNTCPMSA